jgi:hypothetical protein
LELLPGITSNPSKSEKSVVRRGEFRNMVIESWVRMNPHSPEPIMKQFASNLKLLKVAIKKWVPIWKERRSRSLMETEEKLKALY